MRPRAYRLALAAGTAVSAYLFLVLGQGHGISRPAGLGALAVLLACAMVGARLLFVTTCWPRFRAEPSRAFRRGDPGAASFGGIFGALAATLPLAPVLGVPLGTLLDLVTLAGLPGLAVGRVGCLLNGCCPGRPGAIPLQRLQIPAALSAWALALGTATIAPSPGSVFLVGAAAYAWLRVLTDFLRELPRVVGLAISCIHGAWS
jgi:prolipoprotein diacylglyceryltransferase